MKVREYIVGFSKRHPFGAAVLVLVVMSIGLLDNLLSLFDKLAPTIQAFARLLETVPFNWSLVPWFTTPIGLVLLVAIYLQSRANRSVAEAAQPGLEWIKKVAADDRHHLSRAVFVVGKVPRIDGLRQNEPFIDFVFDIFNGSVFSVFLDGRIEGHVRCGDTEMSRVPEFVSPPIGPGRIGPNVEHAKTDSFTIRQYVNPATAAELLRLGGVGLAFDFRSVAVFIGASNDGTDRRCPLQLGMVEVPAGEIAAERTANEQREQLRQSEERAKVREGELIEPFRRAAQEVTMLRERESELVEQLQQAAQEITQLHERERNSEKSLAAKAHEVDELKQALKQYTDLQPLRATAVDYDRSFVRLIVENPNPIPLPDCYVQLRGMLTVKAGTSDFVPPARGHRFPRGSLAGGSSVTFPIGARGSAFVDVAFYLPALGSPGGFTHWFVPSVSHADPNRPVATEYRIPVGTYDLDLELGSESAQIMPTSASALSSVN